MILSVAVGSEMGHICPIIIYPEAAVVTTSNGVANPILAPKAIVLVVLVAPVAPVTELFMVVEVGFPTSSTEVITVATSTPNVLVANSITITHVGLIIGPTCHYYAFDHDFANDADILIGCVVESVVTPLYASRSNVGRLQTTYSLYF